MGQKLADGPHGMTGQGNSADHPPPQYSSWVTVSGNGEILTDVWGGVYHWDPTLEAYTRVVWHPPAPPQGQVLVFDDIMGEYRYESSSGYRQWGTYT